MASIAEAAAQWHDAYALLGGASATLIGLLFVAASVGSGVYDDYRRPGLRVFLTPTVVHFTCVLAASLAALSPIRSGLGFGFLICADGVFGAAYAGAVCARMARQMDIAQVDWDDRICYAVLPTAAYAIMIAGGFLCDARPGLGLALLGGAMALLLLVGIRNAWDTTLWTVVRRTMAGSAPVGQQGEDATPAAPPPA